MLLLSACADLSEQCGNDSINDPYESFNRSTYESGYFLDRLIFRPLAELYRVTIPPGIRARVANVIGNMKEPGVFANNVLQGEFGKAGTTLERFGINTTVGIGGMWDFAGEWGMYRQTGDFGQTLAVWGMDEGPYIFLPLFGPSDMRDTLGRAMDFAMSPWPYVAYFNGGTNALIDYEMVSFGSDLVVRRERNIEKIDILRASSLDFYATARSAFLQHRRQDVCGHVSGHLPQIEDYKIDDEK